ncbi:cytokine receptor family member b1 isoform X2 [Electrophorus electricus]|uniref:cytokine receptor family member b1 isoform X2 n=1 Tax=Electrophorus electricus TaxID=8005 RepID=UPI0015D02F18|nr:cytokine receptor family member b1 isoform X2 [Electrophorus electricus]
MILFLLLIHYIHDSQASFYLPTPVNATLVSNNFQHILRWSPGRDTPPQTAYRVKRWRDGHEKLLPELRHRNHTIEVSKYMKNIYAVYTFQLRAFIGNRSAVVNVTPSDFCPYEMTTIGPPSVDVLGCGDCLNITILLWKGDGIKGNDSDIYYNQIRFILHWKKATDEKDVIMKNLRPSSQHQNATYAMFVYNLENLQPLEEYCVMVKPDTNVNSNTLSSGWICTFTSTVQPRGVTFLLSWSVGSILVGLCILAITTCLAYIGILCKLKVTVPKALTGFVLGHYASLEEVCVSVAEFDCGTRMNKLKVLLQSVEGTQENEEKSGSEEEEDEDEEDSSTEGHCAYMERARGSRDSCTTNKVQSSASTAIFTCESANSSEGCSFEDVHVQADETALYQFQLRAARDDKQMSLSDSVGQKPKPPKAKELEKEQIKEEAERGGLRNINLFSVTLKSMQLEEDMSEAAEMCEPLLPLLLKDQQEDTSSLLKPRMGKPQLSALQTPVLYQKDSKVDGLTGQKELKDFSEMRSDCLDQLDEKVSMETGCMQTGNECASEEDEDFCSDYLGR